MPGLDTTITVMLTEEFKSMVEQAKEDFKKIHTEMTESMRAMIAEEVKRQLEGVSHHEQLSST